MHTHQAFNVTKTTPCYVKHSTSACTAAQAQHAEVLDATRAAELATSGRAKGQLPHSWHPSTLLDQQGGDLMYMVRVPSR